MMLLKRKEFEMIFSRMLLAGFFLAVSACTSQGVFAESKAPIPSGSIMFTATADGGDPTCAFSLRSGDHLLDTSEANNCRNDKMNYFRLENAPSATYITFYSDKDIGKKICVEPASGPLPPPQGWVYRIKTYIQPVTTGWIQFTTLNGTVPEDGHGNSGIVQRGVILVSKNHKSGDHKDELSCVRVQRSAVP